MFFFFKWGHFIFQLRQCKCFSGNVFLIGSIVFQWGQLGTNVFVEFKNVFLIRGLLFSNWGQLRANEDIHTYKLHDLFIDLPKNS